MTTRYTIRYRCNEGATQTALIVEDARGIAYLFRGGSLRQGIHGNTASASLARVLEDVTKMRWIPVPAVASYTLDELHRLTSSLTVSRASMGQGLAQDGEGA